jgi:hypothetical protein
MGKFDMETRLSIHLTFAETYYRTGSDIYRSYFYQYEKEISLLTKSGPQEGIYK